MSGINSTTDLLDKNLLTEVHTNIIEGVDKKDDSKMTATPTFATELNKSSCSTGANKTDNTTEQKSAHPFWLENPNVLFHKEHLLEFFPTEEMLFNQKLNAITRLVILMTVITFAYTKNVSILYVGLVSMFFIYVLYKYKKDDSADEKEKEGFELSAPVKDLIDVDPNMKMDMVFQKPSPANPLGNVLVTDYLYNPKRKPAPPAYNEKVSADIVEQAKQMVINSNPGQEDLADKLFKDLGDAFVFEQSLRPFYSTASTTIPNDQEAFAQFCYGSMISCKEGNPFACVKNNATKWTNH